MEHDDFVDRPIALIGMMGAGKSTVGRRLASRLHREFLDSDAVIEAKTGSTVARIFEHQGEVAFRDLEAEAVVEALKRADPVVIGVAGGAILRSETRSNLKDNAHVFWLRAPLDVLIERVGSRPFDRPLLAGDPEVVMRRLYEQREPLYRELADHVIDAAAPAERVVDDIVRVCA